MTKIIGFRDRLRSLGFGIVATVETILYVILIILVAITKAIFYIISFFYIILAVLFGIALFPTLVVLGVGLLPLEIIIFLITGETKAFTILYELAVNYWDWDNYPYKLFEDICHWLEKPWVLND
jgi:hypothetical protein